MRSPVKPLTSPTKALHSGIKDENVEGEKKEKKVVIVTPSHSGGDPMDNMTTPTKSPKSGANTPPKSVKSAKSTKSSKSGDYRDGTGLVK